jgi:hypothetical protein
MVPRLKNLASLLLQVVGQSGELVNGLRHLYPLQAATRLSRRLMRLPPDRMNVRHSGFPCKWFPNLTLCAISGDGILGACTSSPR